MAPKLPGAASGVPVDDPLVALAVWSTTFTDVDLRRVRTSHVEVWVRSMTIPTQARP